MKRIVVALCLIAALLPAVCLASEIFGKAQDQMERSDIEGALAILLKRNDEKFSKTVVSGKDGTFVFRDVDPGTYNIEVVKSGYFKNVVFDLKVDKDRSFNVTVRLLKQEGKGGSEYCFMLGGIEVQSIQKSLLPEELTTTRKIDTGEIDHMQATSLGDVLSLVPGVDKSQNPGLSKATQVGIRSVTTGGGILDQIDSYGTAIVVDGNQLSTTSNASSIGGTSTLFGASGTTGLDLRTIPSDNIKSVEVITGIPSVEYGNFASGVIKVETKSGKIAPKLNAKINPDTKSASFTHGFDIGKSILDYHLNYAYSERDLRKVGDEYQRFYVSGNLTRKFLDDKLETKLSSSFTKTLDDEKPTDIDQMLKYNHGYLVTGNFSFEYQRNPNDRIKGYVGVNLNRKKSYRSKWVAESFVWQKDTTMIDTMIVAPGDTSFTPIDTSITKIDPGYTGKLKEIGKEWQLSVRLQRRQNLNFLRSEHEILSGIEANFEKNTGPGLIIDSVKSYYGQYSTKRSYSFDDFPDLPSLAIYVEDEITGKLLGRKYIAMLGIRYDAFSPTGFNFSRILKDKAFLKTEHGDFLSPRINLQYVLSDDIKIRMGVGRSAKAVSLGYIYMPASYYKYRLDDQIIEEEQIQYNPDLQAYSIDKYEASVDWKFGETLGFSLTGYYQSSDDMPTTMIYPWGYDQNPDTITSAEWKKYENCGWSRSNGLEFTLRTKRFANFQYRMGVTYRFNKGGRSGLWYHATADTSWEDIWYKYYSDWSEKVILDYQINYISNRLGVWITLDVQNIPLEHHKNVYHSNSIEKTIDGKTYLFYQEMTYYYERYLDDSGGRWLMNFRITKSLSQTTEISLFVNNIFDDRAPWKAWSGNISELNPTIFYGLEVSAQW
ncbi:MAG: TonB-dependent receptor [Candidatus Neomarinimicrobiota bacterium]